MNCPEISSPRIRNKQVRFSRFDDLHPNGKILIRNWFDRSWESHINFPEDFEAFIFLWFSFNAWASCITNTDRDAEFIKALSKNSRLNVDFKRLFRENAEFSENVRELANLLPIFDVKTLKKRKVLNYAGDYEREALIQYYFRRRIKNFEPACWKRHILSGNQMPLDWKHILKAIYKIRCNLFHGQKMADSEMDIEIVSAAFKTLYYFLAQSGYYNE